MKFITKLFTSVAALFAVHAASAQCNPGEAQVDIDFTTDAWGYEVYWEVVPLGGTCGTAVIASGGNATVGCAGGGAQSITTGGYGNSMTINESIGCLTLGTQYDLIMVDDWGDGLTVAELIIDGVPISSFEPTTASETFTFLVDIPANNLVLDSIFYNGLGDNTEKDVYFYQIPLRHAKLDTMVFAGGVTNRGTSDQTNVTYTVDINGPFPYNEMENLGTIAAGTADSSEIATYYASMKQMGNYNFTFTIESDSTDELPLDNEWSHTIAVTDTVYARDNNNLDAGWASQVNPATNQVDALEVSYYINDDDVATSVSIRLYDFQQITDDIGAVIQLYISDGNDPLYKSAYHVVDASDVTNGMLTLPLLFDVNDVALTGEAVIPAGFYTAGISVLGGTAMVGIDPDLEAAPQTQFVHNGGTWFYTTGSIYQIRLNVKTDPCNALSLNAIIDDVSCDGGNDGAISLIATGGTAPYSFNWDNAVTTSNNPNLSNGDYYVTVTDDAGCVVEGLFGVNEPDVLVATVSTNDASCGSNDGNASVNAIDGTAPYSYIWDNTMNVSFINNIAAGTYGVTVTDDNGCTASASGTVNSNNSTITIGTTVTSADACGYDMGSAIAAATSTGGAVSYLWDNGQVTDSIVGVAAGMYTVTVTDADGCSSTDAVTITEIAPAIMVTVSTTDATCGTSDGSATVSTSTAYTYAWDDAAFQTTATATGLEANVYFVMVTDTTTTCQGGWVAYVNNPSASISLATTITNVDCYGSSTGDITVAGSSSSLFVGYSFWTADGDSITSIISNSTESFSGLAAGDYIVIGGDIANCLISSAVSVNELTMLMASTSSTDITCNGDTDGSAAVVAMGGTTGYGYAWDNGSTTASAAGLSAGNEGVTVTDANGCMVIESASVGTPTAISLAVTSADVSCNGAGDGSINVMASGGGVGGYTYTWDNGLSPIASQAGLAGGSYNVTVIDANSCTAMTGSTIVDPSAIGVTITTTDDFVCFGEADGSATSTISGGTAPFSYFWSGAGSNSANNSNIDAGAEELMVVDANGCSATSNSIAINEGSSALAAAVSGTDETCLGCDNGTASVVASGGDAPYTYSWNVAGSTASLSALDPVCPFTTYISNITDVNGCTASGQVNVLCGPDAIDEIEGLASMVVYPNPNNGIFNVELNTNSKAEYSFTVRNVIGQTVSMDSETINGNYVKTIDLSNQTDGIYFLTVKSTNSEQTAKIIVR
ncbi:MAG: T9SS type A sorting domain-containing protein [Flavobacteriales bacterium]|nr:T9SS type A sorting domain-containing protein [Flavobacteriales bacterium]